MEINNGIIIDGVLHEMSKTFNENFVCSECSLRDLCQNEFGNACLCWINLYSVLDIINNEFKCRGKVTDIKTRRNNESKVF